MPKGAGIIRLHENEVSKAEPGMYEGKREQKHSEVGRVDLEPASGEESPEIYSASLLVLGEEQSRDQESGKDKEQVNSDASAPLPVVEWIVSTHHQENGDSA